MKYPGRSEVWLVDLGMAAKVRPCLVISTAVEGWITLRSIAAALRLRSEGEVQVVIGWSSRLESLE